MAKSKSNTVAMRSQTGQIRINADEGVEVRTESLFGREWLVVPVVAMIEGVRFGANQDSPELGLAAQFGEIPVLWNNKPLVLNHPQKDGSFVSAQQDIEVLESYYFGITMNAYVDDSKLKMEAWFDKERVQALKDAGEDAFSSTIDRIQDGETVEVSVGFYSDLEPKKGKFKGQSYSAIWKNIRPDHLAILTEEHIGACSVADGCGVPRINTALNVEETNVSKPGIQADKGVKAPKVADDHPAGCSCGGHVEPNGQTESQEDDVPFEAQEAAARANIRQQIQAQVDATLRDQSVDPELIDSDVRKLLSTALSKLYGSYTYAYGFTNDYVIFEKYDYSVGGGRYTTYQQNFNIADSKVEFVGSPEEVVLLTKIVPQTSKTGEQNEARVQTQENDMTKPNDGKTEPKTQSADEIAAAAATQATTQAADDAAKKKKEEEDMKTQAAAAPKVLTAKEYIDQAPAEVRDVLQSSMRIHESRKNDVITALKAHPKNKFSDDYLKAQSLEVLENMAEYIGQTPNYSGVATPSAPQVQTALQFVEAPKVFEKKVAAA